MLGISEKQSSRFQKKLIQLPQPFPFPIHADAAEQGKDRHAGDDVRDADDAGERSGDEAAEGWESEKGCGIDAHDAASHLVF